MEKIQCGAMVLLLNGDSLSDDEIAIIRDRLTTQGMDDNEIDAVINSEIKIRTVHANIIELNQFELIAQMVESDPNGWFVCYCQLAVIDIT